MPVENLSLDGSKQLRRWSPKGGKTDGPRARQLTKTEAAWLAGLFDGEGSCYSVQRRNMRCALVMVISMTNEEIIRRVHELVGCGNVTAIRAYPEKNRQPAWRWQCYGSNCASLLEQMFPWLIVKRDKAAELTEMHYYYFMEGRR